MVYLKEWINLTAIKRRVANAFSEKGQEAADAIRALIDELESAEVEVDETALAEKIQEVLANAEPNTKTEEAIANAIAKRMQASTDTVGAKNLSAAVKHSSTDVMFGYFAMRASDASLIICSIRDGMS